MFNFSKKKNKNIEDIFDSKLIEYYKTNKNEITSELRKKQKTITMLTLMTIKFLLTVIVS